MQQFYELARDQRMEAQVWHAVDNQSIAHFHSAVELILVEEGSLVAMQEGRSRVACAGEIIVNSSYTIHGYTTPAHAQTIVATINGLNLAVLALLMEKVGLKDKVPSAESDLVRELLMYLQNHFSEELTVAGTAAQFGYSAGRFSHIFNARVGCSFTRYVNGLRCRMAEKVLRESNMPLMDVASACGFSSMRTFHRVYREYAGHTPRRATP